MPARGAIAAAQHANLCRLATQATARLLVGRGTRTPVSTIAGGLSESGPQEPRPQQHVSPDAARRRSQAQARLVDQPECLAVVCRLRERLGQTGDLPHVQIALAPAGCIAESSQLGCTALWCRCKFYLCPPYRCLRFPSRLPLTMTGCVGPTYDPTISKRTCPPFKIYGLASLCLLLLMSGLSNIEADETSYVTGGL